MKARVLVGGEEFLDALRRDLPTAREYVYAQALTFEGDRAGRAVADLLGASPARDRRLVVDRFSDHVISDRCVWGPRNPFDRALRDEKAATERTVHSLRTSGVGVRYVNPVGPLLLRFPARNHKKLVVVDDRVAYIGGINFSDHNFAWHDIKIRIEGPPLATFLRDDFLATWRGRNQACSVQFGGMVLHVFDGRGNERRFEHVFEILAGARRRIFVECPYLTEPFRGALLAAARRGVAVTAVVPARNNWRMLGQSLAGEAARAEIDVRFLPGMTHMKAMWVDDEVLLVGSANFDLISYHFQQEYLAEITDPALLSQFQRRVLEPDLALAVPAATAPDERATRRADRKLAILGWLAGAAKPLIFSSADPLAHAAEA